MSIRKFLFFCAIGIIVLLFNYVPDKVENGEGGKECYVERFYTFRSPEGFRNISFSNGTKSISYPKYNGFSVCFTGKPVTVISRGEVIVEDNELNANPGRGQYIKREVSSIAY